MNFDQLVTLCSDTHQQFVAAAGRTINTHLAEFQVTERKF